VEVGKCSCPTRKAGLWVDSDNAWNRLCLSPNSMRLKRQPYNSSI
jgi:hypothetical protein